MVRLLLYALTGLSLYGGSISGVVTDITGAGIPAAKLAAIGWNGDKIEAMSDPVGHFLFAHLQAGEYSIEVSFRGFRDKKIERIQVREDEDTKVPSIELSIAVGRVCVFPPVDVYTPIAPGKSQLSGIVSLGGKIAAQGARLTLYGPKNRKAGSTVAVADGHFLLSGLRPGTFELRVRLRGFADLIVERVEIKTGFRSETETLNWAPCADGAACLAVKWASMALCL